MPLGARLQTPAMNGDDRPFRGPAHPGGPLKRTPAASSPTDVSHLADALRDGAEISRKTENIKHAVIQAYEDADECHDLCAWTAKQTRGIPVFVFPGKNDLVALGSSGCGGSIWGFWSRLPRRELWAWGP